MRRLRLLPIVILLPLSCARLRPPPAAIDRLKACSSSEGPTDAYCGKVEVFEDRAARAGRKLALKVIVLPGLRREPAPDPIFYLAGGPGGGAAKMARFIREPFRTLQTDRDIVLVDQRGTGDSNPLDCKPDEAKLETDLKAPLERLRACVAAYPAKADVRLYTTPIAMDDLDDVRQFLGYEKIDLYGGSYGSRAAIVYTRRHAPHVRAAILDGVVPTDMRIPLYMARDGERALQLLIHDCDADPACHKRFPDLGDKFTWLLASLDVNPRRLHVTHPRTGADLEITLTRGALSNILFAALYSPRTAALIPLLIERADKEDYQGFLALASNDEMAGYVSEGLQFSVLCSEDAPRIEPGSIERETANTFFGPQMAEWRMRVCGFWPRGQVDPAYYDDLESSVPALILSGELDPITPPSWGQRVASHWKNSRHVIVPGAGHGAASSGCVMKLMREFLNQGSAAGLNVDCVQRVRRPPFFLGPSGPDPGGKPEGKSGGKQ
jgi:pimeloyl-ACP methyl ester carboxylesterase